VVLCMATHDRYQQIKRMYSDNPNIKVIGEPHPNSFRKGRKKIKRYRTRYPEHQFRTFFWESFVWPCAMERVGLDPHQKNCWPELFYASQQAPYSARHEHFYIKRDYDKHKKCSSETMRIYYYKKDYWALLSKAPKRPVDTIYLKEGQREKIVKHVETFFSSETRNIYLSFGIPYKSVSMIYGPPGTGKTSMIRGIASVLDCDLYVLPITKEMKDTDFVGAFSYISDNEDKERIIVIEDIDTLFEERKKGDAEHNGITLQSFLNCLDGFTCVEGTMLFLTANKPEVLDYAMVRSCRIDNKIEMSYADKYQTKQMFIKFLPEQVDKFKEFYDLIRHKEFTTASLQEFLFYNRDCDNILELMDQFTDILEKNDPKNFEIVKDENKNFYS